MIFCPSANPQTNQKLTKSLTKSVETGTPHKNVPPKRGGTQTSNQLFSNEHATTQSRSAGRGKYLCLARPCGAVSERERYSPPCAPQQPAPRASSSPLAPQSTPSGGCTPGTPRAPRHQHAGARSSGTSTPLRPRAQTPRPTQCARRVCCSAPRGPSRRRRHHGTCGNLGKALLLGGLGKLVIHRGPLVVLARGSVAQVVQSARNGSVMQILKPQLGVFGLVSRRLGKDVRDLNVASFLALDS